MPDDYYVSKYSGEEIDERLTAAHNAVRYDAAQPLTDAQKQQARENIEAASRATQDAVFAKKPADKSVTLTPAELPAYLAALPRMLTENLTITLTAGTVTEAITMEGFYGGGNLTIQAAEGADVRFSNYVYIRFCTAVFFQNLKFTGGKVYNDAHVVAYTSSAWFLGCSFDAESDPTASGLIVTNGSLVYLENGSFTNCRLAVTVSGSSVITLANTSGSGNEFGIYIWNGGIAILFGTTPELLGGATNVKDGGLIVKKDGTLL